MLLCLCSLQEIQQLSGSSLKHAYAFKDQENISSIFLIFKSISMFTILSGFRILCTLHLQYSKRHMHRKQQSMVPPIQYKERAKFLIENLAKILITMVISTSKQSPMVSLLYSGLQFPILKILLIC